AASFEGANIDPTAWEDKKNPGESRFPAQMRVMTRQVCEPLEEDSFRPILHHYNGSLSVGNIGKKQSLNNMPTSHTGNTPNIQYNEEKEEDESRKGLESGLAAICFVKSLKEEDEWKRILYIQPR
ncbi:unnamed protein product, partial [Ilex paraguariensis]